MNKESDLADDEIDTDVDMSEEITLTICYGDEELIKDPVEEAFPNITIELIDIVQDIEDLEEQFAQGIIPDIIHGNDFPKFPKYEEAELVYDMTDLIEKFQFDLDRFDQNFLDIIRSYSPNNDELWGLPYIQGKATLHYNKNIFDLFGVDYPKDGMTMNEVLDLAEQV